LTAHAAAIADGSLVVVFVDQCHVLWNDACGYVWGPRGERISIPMTNFRERQTYYGAIELCTADICAIPTDTANGDWTMIFVEYVREQFPGKRIVLIWDGASYHRGTEMQEYLEGVNYKLPKDEWSVHCILFAPNAPEQNPMEDVWLKAKQYVRKHWRECINFQAVLNLFEEALNTLSFRFEKLRMYMPSLQLI
jgi:transposase